MASVNYVNQEGLAIDPGKVFARTIDLQAPARMLGHGVAIIASIASKAEKMPEDLRPESRFVRCYRSVRRPLGHLNSPGVAAR